MGAMARHAGRWDVRLSAWIPQPVLRHDGAPHRVGVPAVTCGCALREGISHTSRVVLRLWRLLSRLRPWWRLWSFDAVPLHRVGDRHAGRIERENNGRRTALASLD